MIAGYADDVRHRLVGRRSHQRGRCALAVTTLKRTPVLPEIATIDELGIKGFDATTWHGLVAPARTPKEIGGAQSRAYHNARRCRGEETARRSRRRHHGRQPGGFRRLYQVREILKWTAIVKAWARLPIKETGRNAAMNIVERQTTTLACNVRRHGHLDLPGAGQVAVVGSHAYVGHIS